MKFAAGLFLLVSYSVAFAGQPAHRTLTFEDRVRAQKAIEQVYWNHRIWPKENPDPKPPLSAVMSDKAIRDKVTDYLKESDGLDRWWQRRITADQLQAEMDRMATSTRDAAVLRELFDALGNDPFVIAETLARQTLADRLIRSWYASDTRFHAAVRERAERAVAGPINTADLKTLGGEYHERVWVRSQHPTRLAVSRSDEVQIDPEEWTEKNAELAERFDGRRATGTLPVNTLSSLQESPEGFSVVTVLERSADRVCVASVVWAKIGFDTWWASPAAAVSVASGDAMAAPKGSYVSPAIVDSTCTPDTWQPTKFEMPASREGHTVVWTGTEMIVWGGSYGNHQDALDSGARYNPSTDTWIATSTGANVPAARRHHTAVWTGTEMIVWGGSGTYGNPLDIGGRYSPSSDTWTATGTVGAPAERQSHTAVWTGTQMIVWGGYDGYSTLYNDGRRYTPSTDTWTATSTGTNVPSARYGHTAIWTGGVMVVWGGQGNESGTLPLNTGGRYTPATDSWVATGTGLNLPTARYGHTAVWKPIGTEMIVWGGEDAAGNPLNTGGRFNLSNNQWLATNAGVNAPSARTGHTAVWNASGTEMIVWGGEGASGTPLNAGGRYNLANNQWTATSTGANVPSARFLHTAVWTGAEMIVFGGFDGSRDTQSGGRYNPSTNSWVATASSFAPQAAGDRTTVWTGTEMIVWGGSDPVGMGSVLLNTGWRYSPSTDTWSATSTEANVPSLREDPTAVWTGTEMIVWGGGYGSVGFNDGGRYSPSTDSWTATSVGTNVPSGRRLHTAVWTGTEMIVWGGYADTGGRYSPASDTWTATATVGAPSPRFGHTAVWTGSEMIIWGGYPPTDSGARYNPSTDSWTATSTGTNTPYRRGEHTAVWTGKEMIVWGASGISAYETGGRYNPLTDTWTPTSTGANDPAGRYAHSAVWTGTEMIVWGGEYSYPSYNDGGRYSPWTDTWTPTSTGANVPSPRSKHSGVWTGTEMIVWGGDYAAFPGTPGGRYCVDICSPSVSCGDVNTCTTDTCDSVTGCVFSNNSDACSDGDACTTNDTCGGGVCLGGTAITAPPEIQSIAVAADKATYSWPAATYATRYDVVRGNTGSFPVGPGGDDEVCFDNLADTTLADPAVPDPGTGFWYLARGENECGIGTFGAQGEHGTPGAERVTTTCP